jgi:hypothetical protein
VPMLCRNKSWLEPIVCDVRLLVKATQGVETCCYNLLVHQHGVFIGLHDWWYSNLDSRQMELLCAHEGVRPIRYGSLELSDTRWKEEHQDHNHYRILMCTEQ